MNRHTPKALLVFWTGLLLIAGCTGQEMDSQPYYGALEDSEFFTDGMSARPLVPGTVAREHFRIIRPQLSPALLKSGQERFNIYCSPCHGRVGDGQGMIVQRGFPQPPSYHTQRLRQFSDQHFYNVITHGYGAMYSYAARVKPQDRWAIVAYIRALQLSQHAVLADLPSEISFDTFKDPTGQ